jgi:cobalt-zinc-cadmium efflux system outer membrane protein
MMTSRRWLPFLPAATLAAAVGCAGSRPGPALPEPRPIGRDIAVYTAPAVPDPPAARPPDRVEPAGVIELREALALALLHNPRLAAASWDLRIAEARTLQAGLRPNPELELEVEEFAGSGPRRGFVGAETTIRLSQLVELGGKRAARSRLAEAEQKLAGWDHEAERLAVLTETTIGFIDLLVAQEQRRLAEESVRLSEETFAVVAERVGAGKVSQLEGTRASVQRAGSRIALARAEGALQTARRRLAAAWGSTAPRFTRAAGTLERVSVPPPLEAIEALLERNPEVARRAAEMESRLAALALERAARLPDLTVSAGARRFAETDDHAFTVGLGLALPLFDRNQGAVLEARHRQARQESGERAAEVRVATALAESHSALAVARAEAVGLREEVVPAAGRAFAAAREGYRQGKFGYLEVLDAQRTLNEANAGLLDALARYHRAVAVVESLVGTPLESLAEPQAKEGEEQ